MVILHVRFGDRASSLTPVERAYGFDGTALSLSGICLGYNMFLLAVGVVFKERRAPASWTVFVLQAPRLSRQRLWLRTAPRAAAFVGPRVLGTGHACCSG